MSANDTTGDGQGQTQAPGVFDEYLATVPEDGRETVASYLKNAEKEVNSRFEQASALQKQYEPYSKIEGLGNYDPTTLGQLISWHGGVQSPEGLKAFVTETAKELGLTIAEAEQVVDAAEDGTLTKADIQKLVDEQTAAQVAPIQTRFDEMQSKEIQGEIVKEINDTFGEIESTGKVKLSETEKAAILDLASAEDNVSQPDWLQKGFERYQAIAALAQKQLIDDKSQQPGASLTAGGTAAVEPTTDWKNASEQAKGMLRQARQ
jgi:DNA-binding transcriptional MerR regulator